MSNSDNQTRIDRETSIKGSNNLYEEIQDTSVVSNVIKDFIVPIVCEENPADAFDSNIKPLKEKKTSMFNKDIYSNDFSLFDGKTGNSDKLKIYKKKKKKVTFKEDFIEYVQIEPFKYFNRSMTYSPSKNGSRIEEVETPNSKCKDCILNYCIIY
jgi:hypothetical protein